MFNGSDLLNTMCITLTVPLILYIKTQRTHFIDSYNVIYFSCFFSSVFLGGQKLDMVTRIHKPVGACFRT